MKRQNIKAIARWCVSDRDGNIVIGQPANLPIIVGVVATLLAFVLPGTLQRITGVIAFGAFFTWSWLETFDGTTPLRRIIGGISLLAFVTVGMMLLNVKF